VPLATFAYNVCHHEVLKMTPFEALFGVRCRLPMDSDVSAEMDLEVYHGKKGELWGRLKELIKRPEDLQDSRLKLGDVVWERDSDANWMEPRYAGPFVVEELGYRSARIVDPITGESHVAHVGNLRMDYQQAEGKIVAVPADSPPS
jgi:hypothetical protein